MAGNLAELYDVAVELGLPDESAMSDNQVLRGEALLSRVSDLFAQEAQRDFVPGVSTVRLKVQFIGRGRRAYVRLTERPNEVQEVTDDSGFAVTDFVVKGNEVHFSNRPVWDHFSVFYHQDDYLAEYVTVTYEHTDDIPAGVRQSVAGIVARYLALVDSTGSTVQPSASSLQVGTRSSGITTTHPAPLTSWAITSMPGCHQ